jgi:alanine racemase
MSTFLVSRESLAHNVRYLQNKAGTVPIWAVVKANGYGLGVTAFVRELYELGLRNFCVTETKEAQAIRALDYPGVEILMLRQVMDDQEIRTLWELNVILTVGSLEAAQRINKAVAGKVAVHLKVDTGMGRYGFLPCEIDKMLQVYKIENLAVKGIFTHFNSAFNNDKLTRKQFGQFTAVVSQLKNSGLDTGIVHC